MLLRSFIIEIETGQLMGLNSLVRDFGSWFVVHTSQIYILHPNWSNSFLFACDLIVSTNVLFAYHSLKDIVKISQKGVQFATPTILYRIKLQFKNCNMTVFVVCDTSYYSFLLCLEKILHP